MNAPNEFDILQGEVRALAARIARVARETAKAQREKEKADAKVRAMVMTEAQAKAKAAEVSAKMAGVRAKIAEAKARAATLSGAAVTPEVAVATTPEDEPHPPVSTIGKLMYNPNDAAKLLGISRTRLYQLLADGELVSFKMGKTRRITPGAMTDLISRLERGE